MPVILHPQEYDIWLDRTVTAPEKLGHLYQPYPAELMELYPVSSQVNSARSQGPELIQSVAQ